MNKKKPMPENQLSSSQEIVSEVQNLLGYKFNQPCLADLALTHSSFANEAQRGDAHNERLEFLGDAVLELCISAELYKRYPRAREGDLTRMRANLVNTVSVASIARSLDLDKLLKLGSGEEKQGGRNRDSVLCDAFEAVLGAIYLDGGFEAAQNFINRIFAGYWPENWHKTQELDAKSRLQSISQQVFHEFPVYTLERTSGPEHAKIFEVSLRLPNGQIFHAINSSCKKAEQDAAVSAITTLLKNAQ